MRTVLLLFICMVLSACGYKGRLVPPENPAAVVEEQAPQPTVAPAYQPRDPNANWPKPDPLMQIREFHRWR